MSTLTHFPLEPECDYYSFLDQAVAYFQHGLDSILPASVKTSELEAFFDTLLVPFLIILNTACS